MSDHAGVWRAAADAAGRGAKAALATVSRCRGSLPMASDAKLFVSPERRVGTVGGGCVEADVILQALATDRPATVQHTLNSDIAGDLGLSCGGTVDLFLEPVVPEAAVLYAAVADAIDRRVAGQVTTAHRWERGPRKLARLGEASVVVGDMPSGEVFEERVPRAPRLVLFGAGHVAEAIAQVAAATDFRVTVVDDRVEFANPDRFPGAQVVVDDLRAALSGFTWDADDYVIACTRGHAQDALVVQALAGSPARYVGMLGSRRKQAVIWQALAQAGVRAQDLARVRVPIGEAIGADTPGEIGVSVMAELIRLRRLVQTE